jgi:hypothetical protein
MTGAVIVVPEPPPGATPDSVSATVIAGLWPALLSEREDRP